MSKNDEYEVLSPWAEADPLPLKGITDRLTDLKGKTIGLFANSKVAAMLIQTAVERKLKERFPDLKFSRFTPSGALEVVETMDNERFGEWVKGVDAVVGAVGD